MYRRIIPCLDMKDGRVVKGIRFRDLRDQGDPVALAQRYAAAGADELMVLNIAGASGDRHVTLAALKRIAASVSIPITLGGGITGASDVKDALEAGAAKVSINTAAVEQPSLLRELVAEFGSRRIVLSVDAGRSAGGWEVVIAGGHKRTGIDAVEWCRQGEAAGVSEILLTSVDQDGTGEGYDIDLIKAVTGVVSIPVIASGGAGNPQHLADALRAGADAVLAASIFHQDEWPIPRVKRWLHRQGFTVKLPADQHAWLDEIQWNEDGLVPVVVEAYDGTRMLGYADRAALKKTMDTGYLWLYSRSRGRLWQKGETSGNRQRVLAIDIDCDADAVRVKVAPEGPTCHTGNDSCFFDRVWTAAEEDASLAGILPLLEAQIDDRIARRPEGSYVVKLMDDHDLARRKVGEEAIEFILASRAVTPGVDTDHPQRRHEAVHEAADLLFHWLVLLKTTGITTGEVAGELRRRFRPRP